MEANFAFYLLLGFCLALSFLLAGLEAGVLALSRVRVRRQMRAGMRRAQLLHNFLENSEDLLWTILVGRTLATFASYALVAVTLYPAVGGQLGWFMLTFGLVVFLFQMLGDLLPKLVFRQFANRLCLLMVLPFRLLHIGLSPVVAVVTWFSDQRLRLAGRKRVQRRVFESRREVRLALQESAQNLTSDERLMVNRVLDLQDLTVRSIIVPLHKVIGVTQQTPVRDLLEICRQQPVSRVPVWDAESKRIVGVVNLSTFLYADTIDESELVGRYAKTALRVREDTSLEAALRRMQRSRQRMAIVMSADQREIGIAHLRDILKSIFGEVTL